VYVDVLAVTPYMLVVGGDLDVLSDIVHVGSGIWRGYFWREGGREVTWTYLEERCPPTAESADEEEE
jgi:hypothetical protein